jgi:GT2 family glycosyltransferase
MTSVTAILVARNGAQYLPATIGALRAQTRPPERIVAIDAASSDASLALLREQLPDALVVSAGKGSLAQVIDLALARTGGSEPTDWYWFLGHDNAAHPRALESLLAAVEVSPSVVVVGPKLVRWDTPEVLLGFGETITGTGASIQLVNSELDQAQHDRATDVLGVAVPGMLVQAEVWRRLGGFDDGLPSVDAGLDFGVRARLAGHRVERVAAARVAAAGPVELFGRQSLSSGARNRMRRRAQYHRRLTYAPAAAVPFFWLALLPLGVLTSLWQMLAKRPGMAPGELGAALAGMFDGSVIGARAFIARTRTTGWAAIAPFRIRGRDARELRERERSIETNRVDLAVEEHERPSFFGAGGGWAVLLAAIASAAAFGRLFGAPALAGGALAPLGSVSDLWGALGVRWRLEDGGFLGSADPFHALLAVIGSPAWWSPSFAIVIVVVAAMPLSALGAWFAAARVARTGWGPTVAAIGWAAAPPLLAAISGGELGAVIAHVLLPWLVLATLDARRSWSMAAVAGLLFAAVGASAPVLVPGLVLLLVLLIVVQPHRIHRLVTIVIPAAALFAPLVIQQFLRGTPFALLADPGVPVVRDMPRTLDLLLGSPTADAAGWTAFADAAGLPWLAGIPGPVLLAITVAPIAVVALLALFLRGGERAIPGLVIAAVGLATAVASAHLAVTVVDGSAAAIWAGSALSLYWLGLLAAVAVALDGLGRFALVPGIVVVLGMVLAVLPLGVAAANGRMELAPSNGRVLPAIVTAEAVAHPGVGTLELTARGEDVVSAVLHRGSGPLAERVLTLQTTRTFVGPEQEQVAVLAGNLVSTSGMDLTPSLDELGVEYLLLDASGSDSPAYLRAVDAISARSEFVIVGPNAQGTLWQRSGDAAPAEPSAGPGPWDTPFGAISALVQIIVFAFALLLAIPTTRRRRVRAASVDVGNR